ncbi:MAG: lipid-A-disaccharide synthase [Gammaproteobacteria bacterium]|nr:MAG: lipid-A-disaccharide synthase [Gammaproteobacteria bacterium]
MPRIAIIAGEASGDQLGAGLARALRARRPDLQLEGIGGPAMAAAGCQLWRDCEELAVMGLVEVLRHLPRLQRILAATRRRLLANPPDALVGIDAPDFNLRIEPAARAAGIPTLHYVSPSVWAWRRGRVRLLRRACDRVLCLLPFEAEFLERHGVPASFVGHPLADEIPPGLDRQAARAALGLPPGGPVLAILPGSRHGELARLGPPFAAAAAQLRASQPELTCAAAMATPALAQQFRSQLDRGDAATGFRLFDGRARDVLAACDVALVASGTATLEAMLVNRPMVVAYALAPVTYQLARWLRLVRVEHFSLPNLLAGRALVPERLQDEVHPDRLAADLLGFLHSPARCADLHAEFENLRGLLRRDASQRAAEAVLCQAGLA